MKIIIQRVQYGSVSIDNKIINEIQNGYVLLVGLKRGDTKETVKKLADKVLGMRIFPDNEKNMNRSIIDVNGELLVIPQFTLYADTKKRRPSFTDSEEPIRAKKLFDYFVEELKQSGLKVVTGIFGAHMFVEIHNDGPVTIILEE